MAGTTSDKSARLSEQTVLHILYDYQKGNTDMAALAKKHNATECVVVNITGGRNYKVYTGIKKGNGRFTRQNVLAGHYDVQFYDGKFYNYKKKNIPQTIPEQIDAAVKSLSESMPLFEVPAEPKEAATVSINIEFKVNDTVLQGDALNKILNLM